jgi:signal peptidase I
MPSSETVDRGSSRESIWLVLAAEILRRAGEIRFVARGSSMIPSIYPGDLLTVRSHDISEPRQGHIVLVFREDRFWAHRLIRKWRQGDRLCFATRGDALTYEDPWFEESQILGRVTSIVRYGQPVEIARTGGAPAAVVRWAVRNSSSLAKVLLRRHRLRARLLARSDDACSHSGIPGLECR